MKKLIPILLLSACFGSIAFSQNPGLILFADSLHQEAPATDPEIDVVNYMINATGQEVTFQWTRTLDQPFPGGWTVNFCLEGGCYLMQVSTAQFSLAANDTSLLKPVFYPNENPGTGVFRLKLESLTPDVPFEANLVYVAVATGSSGTADVVALQNSAAVFPNPAADRLQVVFRDPDFKGSLQITDVIGRAIFLQNGVTAEQNLDVSGFPAGCYNIQAWSQNGQLVLSKGFVKQ